MTEKALKTVFIVDGGLKIGLGHVYQTIAVRTKTPEDRYKLFNKMREKGIGVQVHYIPVHRQYYYSKNQIYPECKNAEDLYDHILSLPMYYSLRDEDLEKVIITLKKLGQV